MKQRLRAQFRLAIIGQVIALIAVMLVFAWAAVETTYLAVPVVLGVIIALQVYALVRSVERHVDTLEDFFAAIHYEDLTRQFVTDDVDAELKAAFNRIIDRWARYDPAAAKDWMDRVVGNPDVRGADVFHEINQVLLVLGLQFSVHSLDVTTS